MLLLVGMCLEQSRETRLALMTPSFAEEEVGAKVSNRLVEESLVACSSIAALEVLVDHSPAQEGPAAMNSCSIEVWIEVCNQRIVGSYRVGLD